MENKKCKACSGEGFIMDYDDSPGYLTKFDCGRCRNTGIDASVTGRDRLSLLIVKLDDAIHWREKITDIDDRVDALHHVENIKQDILFTFDKSVIINESKS